MDFVRLKSIMKRSKAVHSCYKAARNFREFQPKDLLQRRRFVAVFRSLPNTMVPIPALLDLYDAMNTVNLERIEGDVVECGVWNGGCAAVMALANADQPGPKRTFHLFDSFQGLPQPTSQDTDVLPNFKAKRPDLEVRETTQGDLVAIGACVGESHATVQSFLVDHLGLDASDLVFHPGWFQETVPPASETIGRIALLRLDGDWYESTKVCIENFYDKVAPGGFIIIDDYGAFEGCRKAIDEYFSAIGYTPKLRYSNYTCAFFRKPLDSSAEI